MNRFRTKKKAKENADEAGRPSHDSDVAPMPALKPMKTFRRKKEKEEAQPKLELDLANALPPSDDFRTSLLMTGLSARFSMLREQDDPKSKIGKASDDSVLFPKRQSRLNDFGFNPKGLADIAEVGSINESIRRPFASDRVSSFHSTDGYGADVDGSIMARGKPAEGNNLFGGRQKIYKVPMTASGSSKNLNAAGEPTALGGRALYDDDVSQSAFQKLREREREEREREREEREQQDLLRYNQEAQDLSSLNRSESPPLSGYNRNRETSSTTSSSGPYATRSSTAATSFTSQRTPSVNGHSTPSTPALPNQSNGGMERSFTKTRRLYETGLDQHLHTQQFSAVNRLDSLSRQGRDLGARTPSPSPASPDALLFDPSQQQFPPSRQAKVPETTLPSSNAGFDFGVKPSAKDALRPYGITPPLSPPVSEGDEKSILPIQPNDKGKATALGTFSKPVQAYDERKYTQRQLQMQQGRETPPLRKHSPPQAFMPKASNQEPSSRNRAESNSTYSSGRSRSSSSVQRELIPRERMFLPKRDPISTNFQQPSSATFLSSPNDSEVTSPRVSVSEEPVKGKESAWEQASAYDEFQADMPAALHTSRKPPQAEHPALRHDRMKFLDHEKEDVEEAEAPSILVSKAPFHIDMDSKKKVDPPADSPTLPPPSGLSGIIRQHLRSESNASSIGSGPSPRASSRFTTSDYLTSGNPWDNNDWEDGNINGVENKSDKAEANANQSLTPMSNGFPSNQPTPRAVSEASNTPSWEKEISMHHSREGSTETQKERDDFANELAARRKRVQENLRNFAESDSRSQSPVRAPGMDSSTEGPFAKNSHLNFLKSKTSRGSLVGKQPKEVPTSQSKAMKMLGISSSTMTNTPPAANAQRYDDNQWKQEEEEMLRGVPQSSRTPPTKQFRQNRRDAQRERERQVIMRHRQGGGLESGDSDDHSRRPMNQPMPLRPADYGRPRQHPAMRTRSPSRDAPPVAFRRPRDPSEDSKPSTAANSRPGTRDRSSSDASGRSKSHNGRYRDDQAKPVAEAVGDPARGNNSMAMMNSPSLPPTSAVPPVPTSAPPAPRSRSASRSQVFPSYFDAHSSQAAIPPAIMDDSLTPRPSPVAPFAVNPTQALSHPLPSPIPSAASTPTPTPAFQSNGRIPANRKRSVNKSDISEPTFVSTTSRITTVNLPTSPVSPVSAPPLPPMDPRRRQTAKGMFSSWKAKKDELAISSPTTPTPPLLAQGHDDANTFSADEADRGKGRVRQKLRKTSSEGGDLNGRSRQAMKAVPSPAVPVFPAGAGAAAPGGMF